MRAIDSAGTRLRALIRHRRVARLLRNAGRTAGPYVGDAIGEGASDEDGIAGRHVSEADLHAYIDDALDPVERMHVEAFLADHGLIAGRADAYRAEIAAMNAAFRAGEAPLSPDLARLVGCYARAVTRTSRLGAALGLIGLIAILCMISEAALGAAG